VRGLKFDNEHWRWSLDAFLAFDCQSEDRVLMVEPFHSKIVEKLVEPKCAQGVVAQDVEASSVDIVRQLPVVQLHSEHRKHVTVSFRLDVAAPKMQVDDLSVVKGRPVAKNLCQLVAALDGRLNARNVARPIAHGHDTNVANGGNILASL
jgi:hypothetical protein